MSFKNANYTLLTRSHLASYVQYKLRKTDANNENKANYILLFGIIVTTDDEKDC